MKCPVGSNSYAASIFVEFIAINLAHVEVSVQQLVTSALLQTAENTKAR